MFKILDFVSVSIFVIRYSSTEAHNSWETKYFKQMHMTNFFTVPLERRNEQSSLESDIE
jgi:hypothetical protein